MHVKWYCFVVPLFERSASLHTRPLWKFLCSLRGLHSRLEVHFDQFANTFDREKSQFDTKIALYIGKLSGPRRCSQWVCFHFLTWIPFWKLNHPLVVLISDSMLFSKLKSFFNHSDFSCKCCFERGNHHLIILSSDLSAIVALEFKLARLVRLPFWLQIWMLFWKPKLFLAILKAKFTPWSFWFQI